MSLEAKIFKGVSWIALFSFFSQGFSWIITVAIANILIPGDYGLMAMATIITEYASMFNELGLGSAIIQRPSLTQKELSSVFWFSVGVSAMLACLCFPISYLTANIMHEPRVVPLTQTIGIIFIFSGLQIVPSSLLRKELHFKALGFIDMTTVIISCIFMFVIAKMGGGVWALIGGQIIRAVIRTILVYSTNKWRPSFHFNFKESKSYLTFGIKIALSRSLFYIQDKSDTFFAGRAWKASLLGYYSFALQLAHIPTDKIVATINIVSFPAFSKLQHDQKAFNKLYLNITKVTAMIVFPLFMGGFVLGGDLVHLLLNPKWYPIIPLFKLLCIAQIVTSLIAINSFVHTAQGRPGWNVYYHLACVISMPISFYFAVQHGLNAIAIPWLTTYLAIGFSWIYISIRKLNIGLIPYCSNFSIPFFATIFMSIVLCLVGKYGYISFVASEKILTLVHVGIAAIAGCLAYGLFFWIFNKSFLLNLKGLLKRNQ